MHLPHIGKGTNIRLAYFSKNLIRYITPKALLHRRLPKILAELEKRPDKAYILKRVNYYNRLQGIVPLDPTCAKPLAQHKFGDAGSTYFFDSYEFTRWFSDSLQWCYLFGDVTHVPPIPSIVKSRPIAGDVANSVLLNLDKVRHFTFLKDYIPFRQKMDKAIFRLSITDKPHRRRFVQMYFGHPMCDTGIISPLPDDPPEWVKKKITLYDHLVYKFVVSLEGNDVATCLKWVMSTNSLAVMPRPTYETWFMEGTLRPNYHYVEIRPDYADLEERMHYYDTHPGEAEAIIAHAHAHIDRFRDVRREKLISLLVLRRYFERTGQL